MAGLSTDHGWLRLPRPTGGGMRYVRRSDSVTARAYASGGCPAAVDAMDPRDMSDATAATTAAARGACLPSRCPNRPSRPSTCAHACTALHGPCCGH